MTLADVIAKCKKLVNFDGYIYWRDIEADLAAVAAEHKYLTQLMKEQHYRDQAQSDEKDARIKAMAEALEACRASAAPIMNRTLDEMIRDFDAIESIGRAALTPDLAALLERENATENERQRLVAQNEAMAATLDEFTHAAQYDAMMEGPRFAGWNMSGLNRALKLAQALLHTLPPDLLERGRAKEAVVRALIDGIVAYLGDTGQCRDPRYEHPLWQLIDNVRALDAKPTEDGR